MAAPVGGAVDPWIILPRERMRYEEQFRSLNPVNGIVTGEQAKGFLLQSQLPPQILGQIWALADTDADGKMNIDEFSIACKLINLKLRNFDLPKVLPPSLLQHAKPPGVTTNLLQGTPPAVPPVPHPSLVGIGTTAAPVMGVGIPTATIVSSQVAPPMRPVPPMTVPLSMNPPAPITVQPGAVGIPATTMQPSISAPLGMAPMSAAPAPIGMIPTSLGIAPVVPPVSTAPLGMPPLPLSQPLAQSLPSGAAVIGPPTTGVIGQPAAPAPPRPPPGSPQVYRV